MKLTRGFMQSDGGKLKAYLLAHGIFSKRRKFRCIMEKSITRSMVGVGHPVSKDDYLEYNICMAYQDKHIELRVNSQKYTNVKLITEGKCFASQPEE